MLCTCADFCLPPSTLVNGAFVNRDASRAAREAIAALETLRAEGARGGPGLDAVKPPGMGVVKLGFSWEAVHVRTWGSEEELAAVMAALIGTAGCEAPCLLVQDFVPNDFELRVFVVQGRPVHMAYTDFDWDSCGPCGKPDDFS